MKQYFFLLKSIFQVFTKKIVLFFHSKNQIYNICLIQQEFDMFFSEINIKNTEILKKWG